MLAVIETHPIQYHGPVYRALQQRCAVPVTAIYGSDFSVAGYHDTEFRASFKWDSDLLSGYSSVFLSQVAVGGARTAEHVSTRGLRAALQAIRPSAIMLVGYSPRFHRSAWFEARRTGLPLLFRGETTDEAMDRDWVRTRVRDAALRAAYRTCARLLYIGAASHAHFRRLGVPESRLVRSPYCVDVAPFQTDEAARARLRATARAALGIADGQLALLFSGKLSGRKGVDLIPAAVRMLPAGVRERIVVLLVGDGDERESLDGAARQDPRVTTVFTGFVNQSKLSACYHAADLLVLPSRQSETWGLVVNEALHHGVPCIVSDRVGCAPDLIEPGVTGAVFPANSVADFAGAILRTLPLAGLDETRAACRAAVSAYTVERAADGISTAYAAVIAAREAVG